MLNNLALVIEAENVNPRIVVVTWPVLETVEHDKVSFGDRPLELYSLIGIAAGHPLEVLHEGFLTIAHSGIVLDVRRTRKPFDRLPRADCG